ncbi:DUF4328 domain-containing protein [Nocardia brasiliensis]|uniref:DUF4328 domain-containing protein n=1 Tax=Nocardia brasiliensis TaxID=37326 RepID=UPI002455FCCD|nr:DUF4328 domain-containing protein [Nocardia brasiliensis]
MSVGWDAALARGGRSVRPTGALAGWAIALVAAAVVMMFVSAIADWRLLADFEKSWGQPGVTRTEWQSYTGVGILAHLLQFSAGIVVISWLWRARHNAEALCTARHRLANGWVIGGWFCPVVNLWFPHTIMSDVWRASDPRTPPDAPDLRGRPGSALVTAWWLFLLLGWVLGLVALILGIPSSRVERTGGYVIYGSAPVGGFGLIAVELIRAGVLAVSALCLGAVIIQVRRRQELSRTSQSGTGGAPATIQPRTSPASATPRTVSGSVPVGESAPRTLPLRDIDPSSLGPYTLIGRLGADSRGDVFLGSAADSTNVLLRTVHLDRRTGSSDRAEVARVFAAARTVHSDFTPLVLDADAEAANPWMATEYLTGPSLHDLVTGRGPLRPAEVQNVAVGIAHALSAIHDAGLIHGAVTPHSVIITETGPRLIDFGLPASPLEPSAFTAPEQLIGQPAGPASDVFSLGGVLVYALTGRPPFGDTDPATLLHRVTTQLPDLTGIPETGLRFLITGCLTEQPGARLTAAQLLGQLATATSLPASADWTTQPGTGVGDRILTIAVVAIAVILVVIAVVVAVVAITSPEETVGSADTPTRTPTTFTPVGPPRPWSEMQPAADLFAKLIPTTPTSTDGYQGITCTIDRQNYPTIRCRNSSTFAPTFDLYCFPSGRDMSQYGGDTLIERFQRPAGTVTLRRQEYGFQDPKIVVSFENSPRNSCHIYSEAPPDRENEHVEWWRSAPL